MSEPTLADHLARAERALERIEQSVARRAATRPEPAASPRDEALRATVRDVVAQLDALIAGAETR